MSNDDFKKELSGWLADDGAVPPHELAAAEQALVQLAMANAVVPRPERKAQVLSKIASLRTQQQVQLPYPLHHLPLLDAQSNPFAWRATVAHIEPPESYDNIHMHALESNAERDLFVVFVRELVPEEVHFDIMESFLLLEGTCTCVITDAAGHTRNVHMCTGDYIEMQLGETHDVFITSGAPAKAILQWRKLDAA